MRADHEADSASHDAPAPRLETARHQVWALIDGAYSAHGFPSANLPRSRRSPAGCLAPAGALRRAPAQWRRVLHGWPGLDARALARLAVLTANGGMSDGTGWPAADRVQPFGRRTLAQHPHDDGVLLGSLRALDDLPADVDAVVSLCRTGRAQTDREQVEFWLIDQDGKNPNLDFVLADAADTIAALRAEGKRVFLHCAEGRSRTPSVDPLYSALHLGVPAGRALAEVTAALLEGAPLRRVPRPLLICDTDILATALWHERYVGEPAERILERAAAHQPALYILTGDEIPFVQDGLRDGEQIRHAMHERFREVLRAQNVPWIEVRGSVEERVHASAVAPSDFEAGKVFARREPTATLVREVWGKEPSERVGSLI